MYWHILEMKTDIFPERLVHSAVNYYKSLYFTLPRISTFPVHLWKSVVSWASFRCGSSFSTPLSAFNMFCLLNMLSPSQYVFMSYRSAAVAVVVLLWWSCVSEWECGRVVFVSECVPLLSAALWKNRFSVWAQCPFTFTLLTGGCTIYCNFNIVTLLGVNHESVLNNNNCCEYWKNISGPTQDQYWLR